MRGEATGKFFFVLPTEDDEELFELIELRFVFNFEDVLAFLDANNQ